MTTPAQFIVPLLGNGILTAVAVSILIWSLKRDARALRNGVFCIVAVYAALNLLETLLSWSTTLSFATGAISFTALVLIVLSLLLLPFALVGNGLLMARRENRSLGNLLSLLVGLALLALPVILLLLLRGTPLTGSLAIMLLTAQSCAGLLFLVFLVQTVLYSRVASRVPATAVIILGAGLIDNRVSPLLAARLRRAVEAASSRQVLGAVLPLVPSGGQGPDEARPEGEAMAEWLEEQGVAPADIIVEPEARTTEENLRNSARLLEEHGVRGPYLVATNNYHAPRAAMLARSLGIDAHAVGARTALYFLPSAFLREFVAVLSVRRAALVLTAVVTLAAGFLSYAALSS